MLSTGDEIRNLLHRYTELIDAKDVDGLDEMFADAVIDSAVEPGEWRGRNVTTPRPEGVPELVVFRSAVEPPVGVRSVHLCSGEIVEHDDADRARARSRFTVLKCVHGGVPVVAMVGRYEDRFERRDGSWRFVHRRFVVDLP